MAMFGPIGVRRAGDRLVTLVVVCVVVLVG